MFTDLFFFAGMDSAVKFHSKRGATVYYYLFDYRGSNSFISLLMNSTVDIGECLQFVVWNSKWLCTGWQLLSLQRDGLPCSSSGQLWPNQWTTGALSHTVMRLEHKANCSPVCSTDIENGWCLLPLPLMPDVSSTESPLPTPTSLRVFQIYFNIICPSAHRLPM
jgi:hypothetical protein